MLILHSLCVQQNHMFYLEERTSLLSYGAFKITSVLGDSTKMESSPGASASKLSGKTMNEKDSPKVDPRGVFHGHDSTVEDVQFFPSCAQEFCSVGDDSYLILWDARTGTIPTVKVEKAHNGDVHCVDWNPLDVNYILTGSADKSVCGIGEISVLEELLLRFTNLRAMKLLFFVFSGHPTKHLFLEALQKMGS